MSEILKNPQIFAESIMRSQRGIKNILLPLKIDSDGSLTDNDYISVCAGNNIILSYDKTKQKTIIIIVAQSESHESDLTVKELHELINLQFSGELVL